MGQKKTPIYTIQLIRYRTHCAYILNGVLDGDSFVSGFAAYEAAKSIVEEKGGVLKTKLAETPIIDATQQETTGRIGTTSKPGENTIQVQYELQSKNFPIHTFPETYMVHVSSFGLPKYEWNGIGVCAIVEGTPSNPLGAHLFISTEKGRMNGVHNFSGAGGRAIVSERIREMWGSVIVAEEDSERGQMDPPVGIRGWAASETSKPSDSPKSRVVVSRPKPRGTSFTYRVELFRPDARNEALGDVDLNPSVWKVHFCPNNNGRARGLPSLTITGWGPAQMWEAFQVCVETMLDAGLVAKGDAKHDGDCNENRN